MDSVFVVFEYDSNYYEDRSWVAAYPTKQQAEAAIVERKSWWEREQSEVVLLAQHMQEYYRQHPYPYLHITIETPKEVSEQYYRSRENYLAEALAVQQEYCRQQGLAVRDRIISSPNMTVPDIFDVDEIPFVESSQ